MKPTDVQLLPTPRARRAARALRAPQTAQVPRLDPASLEELSRISVGRTPLRAGVELSAIALLAVGLELTRAWWAYPLVALLIASRQHALLVLMHDCAHFRATRTRWLNVLLGELLAWPFLMSMRGYQRHHQRHHLEGNLNTLADPDYARLVRSGWRFPMSRGRLVRQLAGDVLLLNTPELLREARDARNNVVESREELLWLLARVAFLLCTAGVLTLAGGGRLYLLYWLLPSLSFLKAILRLRAMVDHFGLPARPTVAPTRTVLAPWWERLLLAPCNIGIHHVHHAHASLPYYRLREAHERLWRSSEYRARVQVSPSYRHALLVECCPRAPATSEPACKEVAS